MDIPTLYNLFLKNPRIVTDSRKVEKGDFFFALKGEQFNGNAFAQEALEKGASYAIIDEDVPQTGDRTIRVKDTLATLQELARHHRKQLGVPILSLTGSNGKTTTKELLHAVLSQKFRTAATRGNLNNHIGAPLTLLTMDSATQLGIVEMGANHQGEIAFLCSIALPDYGCITNFGKAHLEGFGGVAGVIKGKSELYNHLMERNKTIFYNADDLIQVDKLKNYPTKYGFSQHHGRSDCTVTLHSETPFLKVSVEGQTIATQLIGAYNFPNIAVAIAAGMYFQVPQEAIKTAVENYTPTNNRSQLLQKNGHTIILDAYNANPSSMRAALDNLARFPNPHKIAFLGDMFELGEDAPAEHQAIAQYAETLGLENVYLVGKHFYHTTTSFPRYETFEALADFLENHPLGQKTILIKGSRGMAMERVLEFL